MATAPQPSRKLGQHGTQLWKSITAEYEISDAGGIEMLTSICQATDRAESLREQIDKDGETIATEKGFRDHPCLRHELAARAFIVRTLQKLGLNYEPVKSPGRPAGGAFRRAD